MMYGPLEFLSSIIYGNFQLVCRALIPGSCYTRWTVWSMGVSSAAHPVCMDPPRRRVWCAGESGRWMWRRWAGGAASHTAAIEQSPGHCSDTWPHKTRHTSIRAESPEPAHHPTLPAARRPRPARVVTATVTLYTHLACRHLRYVSRSQRSEVTYQLVK